MSVYEFVFFKVELTSHQVGERLAEALDMESGYNGHNTYVIPSNSSLDDTAHQVRGEIEYNTYTDPDRAAEESIFDDYPLAWALWLANSDEETQIEAARAVFVDIMRTLGWPAILVHELQLALASYDPEHGLREFPAGTSVDVDHKHIWG